MHPGSGGSGRDSGYQTWGGPSQQQEEGEGQVGRGSHTKEEGEEGDLRTQRHQQH